jgi:hypothetical protein
MKQIFLKLNLDKNEKFCISNFLISFIGLTNINLDNLILIILNNFSKETLFYKTHYLEHIFIKLCNYYKSLNFNLYNLSSIGNIESIFKIYTSELHTHITLLNLFINFYYNKPKLIDVEFTSHIIQTLWDQIIIILDNPNTIDKIKIYTKNKIEDEVVNFIDYNSTNMITFTLQAINSVYESDSLDLSIKLYIDKLTIVNSEKLIMLLYRSENNSDMNYEIQCLQQKDMINTIMLLFKNCMSNLYFYRLDQIPTETKEILMKLQEVLKTRNKNFSDFLMIQKLDELSKFLLEKIKFSLK